jgi:hypothetical protein
MGFDLRRSMLNHARPAKELSLVPLQSLSSRSLSHLSSIIVIFKTKIKVVVVQSLFSLSQSFVSSVVVILKS